MNTFITTRATRNWLRTRLERQLEILQQYVWEQEGRSVHWKMKEGKGEAVEEVMEPAMPDFSIA